MDRSSGQFVPVRPSSLSKNDAQYEKKRKGVEVAQKMYVSSCCRDVCSFDDGHVARNLI